MPARVARGWRRRSSPFPLATPPRLTGVRGGPAQPGLCLNESAPNLPEVMTDTTVPALPLIRTKLAPPRIGSAPVERRALLDQLEQQRGRRLHLLVGPAGSGKTSLLVQWRKRLTESGARVAWYNASPDDDDLRLATYLVEALRQAGLPIGNEGLQLFLRSGGTAWQHLLASLVNDAEEAEQETYLVLDNFQLVSSFAVLQLLNRWIALAPTGFHFVLATRVSPPLELTRLRAEGQLMEMGFGELRFDLEETQRFVAAQGLPALEPEQVGNLHRIAGGWAAGLQLLTLSMRSEDVRQVLERPDTLSMNQAQAVDKYLEEAVAGLLQPAELDFLLRISVCRRFNRELCETVSGDAGAAEHLRRFEAANLFLLPIDTADAEPWYRFHPLFAAFLDKRLRRLPVAEQQALQRRAATWFAERGLQTEALRHAGESADAGLLVELIDRSARRMTNAAQYVEFLRWCEKAPPALLAQRVNASLCLALAQLSYGRLREFERTMAGIERHPEAANPEVQVELQLLKGHHAMRSDDSERQRQAVAVVEASPPSAHSIPGLTLTTLICHGLAYAGRFEEAREAARLRFRGGADRRQFIPLVDCGVGLTYIFEGRMERAVSQLQPLGDGSDAESLVSGYLVEALYHAGRIDEVRGLLDRRLDLIKAAAFPTALLHAYRVRARVELQDGDHASALKTLQELEELGLRMELDRLVAWSLYEQLLLALETDRGHHAAELCRRLEHLAAPWQAERGSIRAEIPLAAALAAAEYTAASAAPEEALPVVDAAIQLARECPRRVAEVHANLLRVHLLERMGRAQEAATLARDCLRAALGDGMRRDLADSSPAVRASLQALAPLIELPELAALLGAVPKPAEPEIESGAVLPAPVTTAANYPTVADKVLTVREREILELIGRAYSVKSIARELDVSPGTIKWHVRNIYGKLGAFSKQDALTKARVRARGR